MLLCGFYGAGQHQDLEEVSVQDFRIKAAEGSKREILSGDSLNRFNAANLSEALKQNTAIFVKSYGANGVATLSLRGTGASHNKVFWNGVDISPPNLGLIDLSLLEINQSENLSISYGSAALPEGSGSIGAGLQIFSSSDWSKKFRSSVQLSFADPTGQFHQKAFAEYGGGIWRGQTSLSHLGMDNQFPYRFPGEDERNYRLQQADLETWHLKQNLFARISDYGLWSLKAWYNQTERQLPANILGDPSRFDRMRDKNLYLSSDYNWTGKSSRFFSNVAYVHSQNHFQVFEQPYWDRNDYQSFQNQQRYEHHSAKTQWELAQQNRYDRVNSSSYATAADRFTASLYGRAKYRWNYYWQSALQLRQELYDNKLSPLLGSFNQSYRPNEHWQINLSLARNYRLPSLNDLYWTRLRNPDLAPEESWTGELGLSWQDSLLGGWRLETKLNAYLMEVDNWIQWTPQNGLWRPQNLKSVKNQGFELLAKAARTWRKISFSFNASYQFTQSLNRNPEYEEAGSLAYVPMHQLNLSGLANYRSWRLRYQLNYSDRYFIDEANRYFMPHYQLHDLQLSYRYRSEKEHDWLFSFALHNLANLDYQIIPWRPEPGLNYRIGITWQWAK